jgi:hypothetical protein
VRILRRHVGANNRLKDELNKLYYEQADDLKNLVVRLPIIDRSDALFRHILKGELREHSNKEGMAIYCDWNGKMSSDYKMKADVSNVVIIDRGGKNKVLRLGRGHG